MDALREIGKLMMLDPEGWVCEYGPSNRIEELRYRDRISIIVTYEFRHTQAGSRVITIFPGGCTLGWWDAIRFNRIVNSLAGQVARRASLDVARQIISERNEEVDTAMREVEDELEAQFAVLEEADKRERKKIADAPVASGFLRGAQRRLKEVE